ncbi:MAG: hypothetical protein ACLU0O_04285 [Collinsella sp.]
MRSMSRKGRSPDNARRRASSAGSRTSSSTAGLARHRGPEFMERLDAG